jgi:hypothetical protein
VHLDEDPPGREWGLLRGFHLQSYQLPEPIAFPRDLFARPLAEHARLLEQHAAEILEAPFDLPAKTPAERFASPDRLCWYTTLLVADADGHEVHKWRTADASYVVQGYRGVVRRMTEVPAEDTTYVVVLTGEAVSLHLLRLLPPVRAGEPARLAILERDLVVEPREQWHWRDRRHVRTWWTTPAGDLVASRVPVRAWPRNAREKVEAVLAIRAASVRRRVAAYLDETRDERRPEPPLAVVDIGPRGEELDVVPFSFKGIWQSRQPRIEEALRVPRAGLLPVLVVDTWWIALAWLPLDPRADAAVPVLLVEEQPREAEEEDEPPSPKAKANATPPLDLSPAERFQALWDDFSPEGPGAPDPFEVRFAWAFGLLSVVVSVLLCVVCWQTLEAHAYMSRAVLATFVVSAAVLAGMLWVSVGKFRELMRAIDPARRRRRWEAWKQMNEIEGGGEPAEEPDPAAEHRKEWMRRLANRLARLERLVDLDAPANITQEERRMVREAIAELEKSDADAVMGAWPRAVRLLATPEERRDARGKVAAKDKPN